MGPENHDEVSPSSRKIGEFVDPIVSDIMAKKKFAALEEDEGLESGNDYQEKGIEI